jgi:hypothetical protein
MSAADCTTVVRRAAGKAMVATTDQRSRAFAAKPENEDV